jgi:ABC-type lipoprotein release transport system permease subunit
MYRAFLSWRYMLTRRTNIIGVVGICIGVGALILILSIMSGFLDETRKTVRASLADILIQPEDPLRLDGSALPSGPEPMLKIVRADPRVAAACAQLAWYGLVYPGARDAAFATGKISDPQSGKYSGVRLVGIDVEDEYQTTELKEALQRDPLFGGQRVADMAHPFAPPPGYHPDGLPLDSVLVGEHMAYVWHLRRGSEIMLLTGVRDEHGGDLKTSNRRYVVAGTFRSQENEMDLDEVIMDRRELANLLGPPMQFSQVLVKLKDYAKDGIAVREELHDKLYRAGLLSSPLRGEVRTWEDFRRTLLGAIQNEKTLMAIMLSLVLIVAGFTIFAILSMMVTEKRRDIGILSALGATPNGVLGLFLLIGFWDALLGATAGAVIGTWLAFKIDPIERWLSSTFGVQIFNRDVYLFDHIPAVVDPVAVALIVTGAFVCTLLFALMPAWKAGRMHPLDALRYE